MSRAGYCFAAFLAATASCVHAEPPPPLREDPAAQPPPKAAADARPALSAFGESLRDAGVVLRATVFDDFAAVVHGGEKRGHTNVVSESFGADFDLERLLGWRGARFHVTFNQENGPSASADLVNTGIVLQSRFKPYDNLRLAIMTYEQEFADGRVNVEAGRTTPLMYFNVSAIYCQFQSNALCATPLAAPLYNGSLSPYPYSTWGGRVRVKTSAHTYVQAGAFEVDPSLIPSNGFVWSTGRATGVVYPVEFGYGSELKTTRYARHLRLGGFHDSSDFNDPFVRTEAGLPKTHDQRNGWYAMGDQVVYRPDPASTRNVVLFGGYTQVTDQASKYHGQAVLGAVATGLVPGRPLDTIGVSVNRFRLGDSEVAMLDARRVQAGGAPSVHAEETLFELNYGVQLARGVRLLPALQYLIHPDTSVRPSVRAQPGNAFLVGFRLTIDLHDALGWPTQLALGG